MTKEEALKQFAGLGSAWFGNSKQHFAFSAYCRLQGWNKLADKWKEEAEEEWEEAEEVLTRLVELGCKPADLQEAMKTQEFPFYDDPKQQIETDFTPDAIKMLSELAEVSTMTIPRRNSSRNGLTTRMTTWLGRLSTSTISTSWATRISLRQ